MGLQHAGRMRPAATFTNHVYAVEITQEFGLLYHFFFHVWLANPPKMTGVALCHLKYWTPIMGTLYYYRMQSDLGFRVLTQFCKLPDLDGLSFRWMKVL